ncbi:hypothetical protein LWX53_08360 [bacterium]|nr:hypothetical protein [bacterium]
MKRLFLALALIAAFGTLGAQATSDDWFWGKTIASVQWEGLKKANRGELDSLLRAYMGKPFTEELWLEMQSKLYELDWFDSIEPQALPRPESKDQLVIKFVVVEKPSILSVRVSGNSGVRTSDILAAIGAKGGDIYNAAKVGLDDVAIKKLYTEKGYPDAAVSHDTTPSDDPSLIVLTFRVTEGSQVSLRTIKFTGNGAVSAKTLKGRPLPERRLPGIEARGE